MLVPRILNDCGGRQWQQRTANLPNPGGFAFFVFKAECDWYIGDYLSGLIWAEDDSGYYLAGTFDQFNSACYVYSRADAPADILKLYNYIFTKLSDFGYSPRGTKRPTQHGFYLV